MPLRAGGLRSEPNEGDKWRKLTVLCQYTSNPEPTKEFALTTLASVFLGLGA